MNEIWCVAKGYEERYMVSTLGRVRSFTRSKRGKILNYRPKNKGYLSIGNYKDSISVHRLVALTFIPNPNNLPEVDHIDGNVQNNKVDNLRWATRSQNISWGYQRTMEKRYLSLIPKSAITKLKAMSGNKLQYLMFKHRLSYQQARKIIAILR